jgi:hypothetical protein
MIASRTIQPRFGTYVEPCRHSLPGSEKRESKVSFLGSSQTRLLVVEQINKFLFCDSTTKHAESVDICGIYLYVLEHRSPTTCPCVGQRFILDFTVYALSAHGNKLLMGTV